MKQCTCNSLDLFKGGCLCGAMEAEVYRSDEGLQSGIAIASLGIVSSFMCDVKRIQAPKGNVVQVPLVFKSNMGWNCIPRNGQRLQDWLPSVDPQQGDCFNGINRSIDAMRLSGVRHRTWALITINDVMQADGLVAREGGAVDRAYAGTAAYAQLRSECSIKPEQVLRVGAYELQHDATLPENNVYLLTMGTWAYDEVNEVLFCLNPGWNAVITP